MRLQGFLCFLILFVAIREHQYADAAEASTFEFGEGSDFGSIKDGGFSDLGSFKGDSFKDGGFKSGSDFQDWDFNNYYKPENDFNRYKDKPKYKNDRPYNKKSSYNDDDDSYNRKPSYGDDDDDDKDYKPSRYQSGEGRKSPDDMGHMNIYFRSPSSDGKRKKSKRMRFPVARYDRDSFPLFGPFINFLPWLPIFADRLTKQTIIFSPVGGVYIIPPVINFYGEMYSVAELIASGYASLVSTGVPPPPAVDVAPLVQPAPVVGPGLPTVNPTTGSFTGGVRTEFRHFERPHYPKVYEEKPIYNRGEQYVKPARNY